MKYRVLLLCYFLFFIHLFCLYADGFIPNHGQWPKNVWYAYVMPGMKVFITQDGMVYDFYELTSEPNQIGKTKFPKPQGNGHVVKIKWENALFPQAENSEKQQGIPLTYITPLGTFQVDEKYEKIFLRNIYSGIDVVFYSSENYFRFDFLVHPGASPNSIRMNVEGAEAVIGTDGQLELLTTVGKIRLCDVKGYQKGKEKKVDVRWRKKPNTSFGFSVGEYNKNETLVIDPLVFSTFLGSSAEDGSYCVVQDSNGDYYTCGYTLAASFPTVTGSYDISFNGQTDGFISQFSSNGSSLLKSTFIGGTAVEYIYWLSVNSSGEVYACGETTSADFPVSNGAFSTTKSANTDAFVLKLNSGMGSLAFSSFLGGSGNDYAYSLTHDSQNNVYVCGVTSSANFPVQNAYDNTQNGLMDAFVSKLNSSGSSLVFSTFLGGSGNDYGYAVGLNSSGNVVLGGQTYSGDYPTTAGAFNTTYNTNGDAFISVLAAAGNSLISSTYVGGLGEDAFYGMVLDGSDNIYAAGYTNSGSYPTTAGVVDNTFNGQYDIVISKLTPNVSSLMASTFFGGNSFDYGYCIARMGTSGVTVSGYVASTNMSVTANAYDNSYNGGNYDGFLLRVDGGLSTMIYSTYFGSSMLDGGQSVVADVWGYAAVCGFAGGNTFPVTAGAYDITYNGGTYDAFLARFCTGINAQASAVPASVCQNNNLTLQGSPSGLLNYTWYGPNSYTTSGQNVTYSSVPLTASGIYTLVVQDAYGCTGTVTTNSVSVLPGPNTSVTVNGNTLSAVQGSATYQWYTCAPVAAIAGATQQAFTPSVSGSYFVVINLTAGCTNTSACVGITITAMPEAYGYPLALIYPNPSNGELIIENAPESRWFLYDIHGRKIYEFISAGMIHRFKPELQPGTYLIENEDKSIRKKWIFIP